jgi:hypothetical protein
MTIRRVEVRSDSIPWILCYIQQSGETSFVLLKPMSNESDRAYMKTIQVCICTFALLILTACGDGGSSSSGSNVQNGVFIDSAVEGVTFTTATQSGTTDSDGSFSYLPGEIVSFYIGDILIGSA